MKLQILLGVSACVTGIIAYVIAQARVDRWLGPAPESPNARGLLGLVYFGADIYRSLERAARTRRTGLMVASFLSVAVGFFGFVLLARALLSLPR